MGPPGTSMETGYWTTVCSWRGNRDAFEPLQSLYNAASLDRRPCDIGQINSAI